MISFKYFICLSVFALFTTLILLGCKTERYTTKFELTPVMEDSVTTPERFTKELEEELRLEDTKRMKMLQEKAKKEAEKKSKSAKSNVEEIKSEEPQKAK
ncbi:MAG: hypothetical protein ACE5KZ_04240 [Candidatus Scalinduaceae bacterium]